MRVGVVGAGAIGGFLAAALARAGVSVGVVARGEHLEAIRRHGLSVESDLGDFRVEVDAASDLRELGGFDVLVLSFKAHQWGPLLPMLEPFGGTAITIVCLQNGLPFWYVRKPPLHSVDPGGLIGRVFPDEQIVAGVVHVSGHLERPGLVRQSGGTRYVFGAPAGGGSERVDAWVALLRRAGLDPEADANVRRTTWLKLVNNAGLNPVSALRGLTIAPMLADPAARAQVRELMSEALRVGQAIGAVDEVDLDARIAYAARLADVRTSMLQDLQRGRPLELDPILGALIELAERCGVGVPRARAVYAALERASANAFAGE